MKHPVDCCVSYICAPNITIRYATCSCARRSHSNAGSSWLHAKTRSVAYSKMRASFLLKSVVVPGTTMQIATLNFSFANRFIIDYVILYCYYYCVLFEVIGSKNMGVVLTK